METYTVAKTNQISEINPLIVEVGGITIGIYKFKDRYYAYKNECAHEGGPVVEGLTVGHLECKISPEGKKLGEYFSESKMDIVCPWHGVQYDLETGICRGDDRLALITHEIIIDGEDVKVRI